MYQRCTLLLRRDATTSCLVEYSKVRGDVDLYQVLSLSAVLRSLLRVGAEFEIFAGFGTVCCSSKITMTMARDLLSPASPYRGGHVSCDKAAQGIIMIVNTKY